MEKKGPNNVLMNKYGLGRLLGQGTFAKVYHARSIATGEAVAVKVIDKEKVTHVGMIEQIKREISVMRLIRHPNVVLLHEVMASRTKIYFVMEFVRGGELFTKIASTGRIKEAAARRYFQELVGAVDFCHSRGVYHRDLKPENLLLDENGRLKISDFGLSALHRSRRQDGLLHTMCGTPAYVAPEVINRRGYDGAKADIWSCGVILFVLLAGYLPFHDANLMEMYRKITRGDFKCPAWFPADVRKLLARLLDPNPATRISICKIMETAWFKKEFRPVVVSTHAGDGGGERGEEEASPASIFMDQEEQSSVSMKVSCMNAFDIISQSPGFDLSGLFHDGKEARRPEARRFTTKKPAAAIVSKLEEIADQSERFKVEKQDGMVKLQGSKEGRKGQLAIDAEIFEVTPSFFMVEMRKKAGDTMEYDKFCKQELKPCLEDIVWTWQGGEEQVQNPQDQSPPP